MDHAVELMLKERCVQLGKSIYKSDGTTLTLHETFRSLGNANVTIPEQPRLEDLHDLRNTIQHKGLIPDTLAAQFHVEVAYNFIKRFLQAELQILIDDVIPKRYKTLIEGSTVTPEAKSDQENVSRVVPPGGEDRGPESEVSRTVAARLCTPWGGPYTVPDAAQGLRSGDSRRRSRLSAAPWASNLAYQRVIL